MNPLESLYSAIAWLTGSGSSQSPPPPPPKVVLVPPFFQRDVRGLSRFSHSSYDYLANRKQLEQLLRDHLQPDFRGKLLLSPPDDPRVSVRAKLKRAGGSMVLRWQPAGPSALHTFLELAAGLGGSSSSPHSSDVLLRGSWVHEASGLGAFAVLPLSAAATAPAAAPASGGSGAATAPAAVGDEGGAYGEVAAEAAAGAQLGLRYTSSSATAGAIFNPASGQLDRVWMAGRLHGFTLGLQLSPRTPVRQLWQGIANTTQPSQPPLQPPQPPVGTTTASTSSTSQPPVQPTPSSQHPPSSSTLNPSLSAPVTADGSGTSSTPQPPPPAAAAAAAAEAPTAPSSSSFPSPSPISSYLPSLHRLNVESVQTPLLRLSRRLAELVGSEWFRSRSSVLLSYSPVVQSSSSSSSYSATGAISPARPSPFTATLELSEGGGLSFSFMQHVAATRQVVNPFEEDEVVGITNYLDIGLQLTTAITRTTPAAPLSVTSSTPATASGSTSTASSSAAAAPAAPAVKGGSGGGISLPAAVNLAVSWQINKNWLLKARVGSDSAAAAVGARVWPQALSAYLTATAALDYATHKPKYGAELCVENFGPLRYERGPGDAAAGRALLQRHEASAQERDNAAGRGLLVHRSPVGDASAASERASRMVVVEQERRRVAELM